MEPFTKTTTNTSETPPLSDRERELLARLERIAQIAKKLVSGEIGTSSAVHRRARPQGTLFSDHRRYAHGDDLRFVDWNAYARLNEVFLRIFEPEDSAPISILLDASKSMTHGGSVKFTQAALVAAAFGAVGALALAGTVAIRVPDGDEGAFSGKLTLLPMLRYFEKQMIGATRKRELSLAEAVRRLGARARRAPLIMITDAVPPAALDAALAARDARSALLLHIVDPKEIDPPQGGIVKLNDPESGRTRTVVLTRSLAKRYSDLARARLADVERAALGANAQYLRVPTNTPFDAVVMEALRRGGAWRRN